jgi:hypothetical protein
MRDPVALALDVTPERSAAAIGAAGAAKDGNLAVDVIEHRPGTGWVVARLADLVRRHRPCAVVVDERSAAASLIQDLQDAGVTVDRASTTDLTTATGQFWQRVQPDTLTLRHPGHPALTAAVAGAKRREIGDGGAWAFTRKDVTVDVSPLIAVTLAAWGHGKFKDRRKAKPMVAYA